MSTVRLPSTTKKRQKGVVAQPTITKSRQVDIKRPGKSVGTGPGQGKMEGEGIDSLEQHRLDTMQAPPTLRVEESPPPPDSNVRCRGGLRARGRGRGAARGGRGARGTGVLAVPPRGDGGWGARGSGINNAGPSHMLPIRPPPRSFGPMPTGVIPRPPGMGSRPKTPPLVTPSSAGRSGSIVPGPSSQTVSFESTTRPTYPSLRPVVLRSAASQSQIRSAVLPSETKPNIPKPTQASNTSSALPSQTIPRNYAPTGAYARVLQDREPDRNPSPPYSPRLEYDFIIRDEDAYSPSRPTPMDLDAENSDPEPPTRSRSKRNQGKQREVQSTNNPEGRRDNPVDLDLESDDDDAEVEDLVPEAPPTQPIVDYTSQIKVEPGCVGEVEELEDEEEAEPEPEDDSLKQSSTLVYLRSSNRPELQDCWSKIGKLREVARTSAYCVAANELSEKNRRPTGSIWRDDGFAVDWVLDHRAGSMHFMFPPSMVASEIDARRVWMEEMMVKVRRRFPSRKFDLPIAMDRKMRVFWSGTVVESANSPDPTDAQEAMRSRVLAGKRARSPSPTTSRKVAKTTAISSANVEIQQMAGGDRSSIVTAARNRAEGRLPVKSAEFLPLLATNGPKAFKQAVQDMDSSVIQCLSEVIQSDQGLASIGEVDPKRLSKPQRWHFINFATDLLSMLDKRNIELLPELYHEKCTVSLVPTQGEGHDPVPADEPGLNYCRAMSKQELSNRNQFMDAIGPMRYSNISKARAVAESLIGKRGKEGGLWWIRLHGFIGKLHKGRHFLWSYRRYLLVLVDFMDGDHPKQYQIVTDYMIIMRHGEATLPSRWHWISDTPPAASSDVPQSSLDAVVPLWAALHATNTTGPVMETLAIQPRTGLDTEDRASQQVNLPGQLQQRDASQSGHPPTTVDEGGEAGGIVEPAVVDEEESLQKRMETALEQQDTWQEIKAAAPNARGAVKKLAELEEEIVGLHMRLVALRKRTIPATNPSATSTAVTRRISDLQLAGGKAHTFSRMAGDKLRFMLRNHCDLAVYSMRGVVQHVSDKLARPVSTILENGLRVVDGCMPTSGKVVMVVEKNAIVPVSKNPQQLLLWDRDEQGNPRQNFLPKAPHTSNPSCVVAIGCDDDGTYRFASGGTTDRKVVLWDVKNPAGKSVKTSTSIIQHHSSALRSLAFDAVHGRLFGGTTSGRIMVQDLEQRSTSRPIDVNAAIFHLHTNPTSLVHSIAVEAEQTRDQFYVYDVRGSSKRPTHRFGYDINAIPKVTLSKFDKGSFEGNYFARGYGDGTVRMWDLRMVGKKSNQENPYMVAKASNDPIRHVVLDDRKLRVLTQAAITTYDLTTQT